ncbi:hypothetical protein LWI28_002605 [Acer negundo]|uniref:GOLD domain-containing protein n=1 Tax=Acer negundo TaxID=4023 RepID=A0AAD5ICN4_ACENE|nr:hypothetical protein LWI28_002605 [Acer negundo]
MSRFLYCSFLACSPPASSQCFSSLHYNPANLLNRQRQQPVYKYHGKLHKIKPDPGVAGKPEPAKLIKGPSGEQIHDFRDKVSEEYEFVVRKKGVYQFCFTNKSPYHETIDFDICVGHSVHYDQHAKDEHFSLLLEQVSKLEEDIHNIQFEQHWLEAQTNRRAIGGPPPPNSAPVLIFHGYLVFL